MSTGALLTSDAHVMSMHAMLVHVQYIMAHQWSKMALMRLTVSEDLLTSPPTPFAASIAVTVPACQTCFT